ncbi:MAG TPA: amidohydrolase family protein [Xanthobacteraceae bacterium]
MAKSHSRDRTGAGMYPINEDWLGRHDEEVIDPDLAIIDPHHHLWDRDQRYLLDELLDDFASGHNVRASVFVQCRSMYRADGPPELQPVGETEFVNGIAAMTASGHYGPVRACAGIVGHADLRIGARVRAVLEAHMAASSRFRGIRFATSSHASLQISPMQVSEGLMLERAWREGFAELAPLGLSFDALLFHTQLGELVDLARAFAHTTIILNHVGCPIGVGPYAGRREEVFADWRRSIEEVARCENVCVKLGGLGMPMFGFGFDRKDSPPTSAVLAQAWRPYVDTCIAAFGPARSMFESNFPVDKTSCSYKIVWNAFKRLATGCSAEEKAALFHATAARVYRLAVV